MEIGIFTDTYTPNINGVVTSIRTFKRELETHGEHVTVVAPSETTHFEASPDEHLWRLPSLTFYGEKRYRFVLPFFFHLDELAEIPLDVIHTQTPFPVGAAGYKLARRKNLPLVYTHHTRYQEYAHYLHLPNQILRWLTQTTMPRIISFANGHDAVIAPSYGLKRELEGFGVTKPISVIPTGIDIEKTIRLAATADPRAILARFGIPPDDPFMIFTSRIGIEKNIPFILDAARDVFRKHPKLRLLIVGDGPEKKNLITYAEAIGIRDRVVFTGFMTHDDVFPLYRLAKVFLFSSYTETQGLAVAEALAIGLPVVALRAMGIEDVLEGDQGGFLIEGLHDDFVTKTLSLLEDDGLRRKKSDEAKMRALKFSSDTMAEKLIALYENVIAEHAAKMNHG
jgi:1,2-diacylglycerol 3-alpha-glucosyltransferase